MASGGNLLIAGIGIKSKAPIRPFGASRALKGRAAFRRPPPYSFDHMAKIKTILEEGYDIRTVQKLRGHNDVSATMLYAHTLDRGGRGCVARLIGSIGRPR